jgi:adenosylcobyric acid synthase
MEGAGSCAEVNLMNNDLVNFSMAEYAGAPVVLVADIHRGGVFAQIIGTLECIPSEYRKRIKGFIINRFKGDISLFDGGSDWIEQRTGTKVLGILPWYSHIHIEAEDSVVIENPAMVSIDKCGDPAVAVIRLPHISNFTDFDPLSHIKGLNLVFIERPQDLFSFKAVILPGSKNTRFDLEWLNDVGWSKKIKAYANHGGHILGICGGYQMMGRCICDPEGLEGRAGTTEGLWLTSSQTVLKAPKTTSLSRFLWHDIKGAGYEIHMGETLYEEENPLFEIIERNGRQCSSKDGCISFDSRFLGTYIHGLFDTPGITMNWLDSIGLGDLEISKIHGIVARDREYDLLAEHFEKFIDTGAIMEQLNLGVNL